VGETKKQDFRFLSLPRDVQPASQACPMLLWTSARASPSLMCHSSTKQSVQHTTRSSPPVHMRPFFRQASKRAQTPNTPKWPSGRQRAAHALVSSPRAASGFLRTWVCPENKPTNHRRSQTLHAYTTTFLIRRNELLNYLSAARMPTEWKRCAGGIASRYHLLAGQSSL